MNEPAAADKARNLQHTFIDKLRRLRSEERRAELAILGRNAGETLASSRQALGVFYSLLPPNVVYDEEIYFLVATLYPLNDIALEGDFGVTMRIVKERARSESIDRRMAALLDSSLDVVGDTQRGGGDLAYRLRQGVRLARAHDVGVDWLQLLADLCWWGTPGRRPQKRWARSYFSERIKQDKEDSSNVG